MFITSPSLTKNPSEGSQARSKATDSRSVLVGVPRFKSGPSHILISECRLMFKPQMEPCADFNAQLVFNKGINAPK